MKTMMNMLVLVVLGVGCATPNVPYISESRVRDLSRDWASNPRSTGEKWLTVHNPTKTSVRIHVTCNGYPDEFGVDVRAGKEFYAIVTVPSPLLIDRACTLDSVVDSFTLKPVPFQDNAEAWVLEKQAK